jgi:hypothetical protein
MQVKQVFAYLENNLLPDKGGRIQFIEDPDQPGKETLRIFIFDPRFSNYKFIFSFIREEKDKKSSFKSFVKSGFSGIDHKLDIPFSDEMFYDIKEGLRSMDTLFMKTLLEEVSAVDMTGTVYEDAVRAPEEEILEPVETDVAE